MPPFKSLPYRPCVAMAVFNRRGRVFIGRRIDGPEHVDETHAWQLPQGGIDPNEDPWPAALRELYEETNIRSAEKLGEIAEELCYDIPREIVGQAWGGIPPAATTRNSWNGGGSGCRRPST
jgi:putative (di)nucleoside polyphosphate hydrolase